MKYVFLISLALLSLLSCQNNTVQNNTLFTEHKLPFQNQLTNSTDLNILNYLYYYNGAGVAVADFNNDSQLDIYLTANQQKDVLYINKGNLTFESIPLPENKPEHFSTGVTTADINQDGLMDIYVSQVSGHLKLTGHNRLYINQGLTNGKPTFKESSKEYGLNFSGYFTQASFFDYDLDGDLDVFLLKHSVHPNSNYAKGSIRYKKDELNGDMLLENDNGIYKDVTASSGILQTKISYGLGLSTSDINQDGYPDIYIGNDFYENDYLYINQGDGTFKEVNTKQNRLKHTSHFSMGNDIIDLTNDGLPDILSVDMLPENLETLKAAGTEYGYPIYQNQLRNGYQPQYMQNTFHLNRGQGEFSEIAFLSNIAATEWSWSPLAVDFDGDGHKDIFITNGIAGATNDMDFINFISNKSIQQRLGSGMQQEDLDFIKKLPQKKTPNYFFKNQGTTTFTDVTSEWFTKAPSLSNGAAYGDLDNDGDLDLVINNVNAPAQILENKSNEKGQANYIKLNFKGDSLNKNGIGAKVHLYTQDTHQYFENAPTRGFLSSIAPEITTGIGLSEKVDSLVVVWQDGSFQKIENVLSNTTITLKQNYADSNYYKHTNKTLPKLLTNVPLPLEYKHTDATSLDFSRGALIPYASSNTGPKLQTGDLNNDGVDDIVALGAKAQETVIFLQEKDSTFSTKKLEDSELHKIHEDVSSVIFDANGDHKNDLLIVSGGNEFTKGKPLEPRLYLQEEEELRFRESAFQNIFINASTAQAIDLDNDGDLDISISSDIVPREFGKTPTQHLFENDGKANFKDISATYGKWLRDIGNVYDVHWQDIDGNGFLDAVVAGHWMPISILLNDGSSLEPLKTNISDITGWWNSLEVADFDQDGDLDIVAGNWGDNTRINASQEQPIQLYRNDFDDNGRVDPLVTYFYQDQETTIATKDELVKQLPFINKKYLSYNAFAKASLKEVFPKQKLKEADIKKVTQLSSMYFENLGNGNFKPTPLPFLAQISSVFDIVVDDFNNDSFQDLLLVGNNYEISTQLGRLDASKGLILLNDKNGFFTEEKQQNFNISGPARSAVKLDIKGKTHYIVGINNDKPILLQKVED